jgi:hypothetical protein
MSDLDRVMYDKLKKKMKELIGWINKEMGEQERK